MSDEYFAKLEAALTAREASAPAPRQESTRDEQSSDPPAAAEPHLVAQAFTALLALEEGEPGARRVRLTTGEGEVTLTDALIEDLTQRVIERLAPDLVRDVVKQVVAEVSERLVREEIERIRNRG